MKVYIAEAKNPPADTFYAIITPKQGEVSYFGRGQYSDLHVQVRRNNHLVHEEDFRLPSPPNEALLELEERFRNVPL